MATSAWYFRMYGTETGKGQTFHEQAAQSGFYGNSLTVRVGAPTGTGYDENTKKVQSKFAALIYGMPPFFSDSSNQNNTFSVPMPHDWVTSEDSAFSRIQPFGDRDGALGQTKIELAAMRDRSIRVHYDHVRNLALGLHVRAVDDKLPPATMPATKTKVLAAFTRMTTACATKRERLTTLKKERKERRDDLETLAGWIPRVRKRVSEIYTYVEGIDAKYP